ncbi:hypothetical protein HPB51_021306 [Rhipicephalus microplus]|uniref:Uncharacterized protein n=1 Tax=Rhipicephalus microplus TaxID=6941 RepID=A0A9J6F638_RHIMP|nr:hypothetical protein HPB51_021306 [Rhipicephalus microplus]
MAPPTKGELTDAEKDLYKAIQAGDVAEARTLVNRVRIDCLDEHGMTPLQHAAYRGNHDLCKLFLECGADVNSHYHDSGYTALMFAGLAGRADVVSLLLEHGASTTVVNSLGRTAAQMAAFVSNHDVVAIINNFLPREELEYYARRQGLERSPSCRRRWWHPCTSLSYAQTSTPFESLFTCKKNASFWISRPRWSAC